MATCNNLSGIGLLLGLTIVVPLSAVELSSINVGQSVEVRLLKLERQVTSQPLLELLDRIEALQLELQEIRALAEEQTHQIETLKQRQRDLYLDLDRRISRAEREGGVTLSVDSVNSTLEGGSAALVVGEQPSQAQTLVQQQPPTDQAGAVERELESDHLTEEREAYQRAFNLLRQLQYDPATTAFKDFIKKYPGGRYAHIAQYWLGEASYARRDFKQAIADYQLLIDNYPQSPKVAEAMLKLGYSRWEMKAVIGAKTALDQLVTKYPDSAEAKQAQPLLEKLKRRLEKR